MDDEDEVLWALAEQLSITFLPLVGGKAFVHVLLVSDRTCGTWGGEFEENESLYNCPYDDVDENYVLWPAS